MEGDKRTIKSIISDTDRYLTVLTNCGEVWVFSYENEVWKKLPPIRPQEVE